MTPVRGESRSPARRRRGRQPALTCAAYRAARSAVEQQGAVAGDEEVLAWLRSRGVQVSISTVRLRRVELGIPSPGRRGRALTLTPEQYRAARDALEQQGEAGSDEQVLAWLRRRGVRASRSTVRSRRVELGVAPRDAAAKRLPRASRSDPTPRAMGARLSRIENELAVLPDGDESDAVRPMTRGECAGGPRPCPWIACRWHLSVLRGRAPDKLAARCALDVADDGPNSLDEVGAALGLTRERIRQIEVGALLKIAARGGHLAEYMPAVFEMERGSHPEVAPRAQGGGAA